MNNVKNAPIMAIVKVSQKENQTLMYAALIGQTFVSVIVERRNDYGKIQEGKNKRMVSNQ